MALEKPPISSIARIVEYLWHDENVHFESCELHEENTSRNQIEIYPHIFYDLKIVRRWLRKSNA